MTVPTRWRPRLPSSGACLTALAIAFPLLRLWPLSGNFYIDWINHQWLAAYTGEYFRHHGSFPITINAPQESGMAFPVFYGTLFYPALGLFTSWLNPGWCSGSRSSP